MTNRVLVAEEVTGSIIRAFFRVYNRLDYGFLEHLYVLALERELRREGLRVARELGVRVMYDGEELGYQRLDMVVNDTVVVEVKSTCRLAPESRRQLFSYLRATNLKVGLLLHFGPSPAFHRVFCERNTEAPRSHRQ